LPTKADKSGDVELAVSLLLEFLVRLTSLGICR
jgi:hypothetical protein